MKFSIITVALNPGDKLQQTLNSIFSQTFQDYEVILKDGGSKDGSTDPWKNPEAGQSQEEPKTDSHVRFFEEKDTGIYDAMNQAVSHAQGDFLVFMNCGDEFASDDVLEKTAAEIDDILSPENQKQSPRKELRSGEKQTVISKDQLVVYGDTLGKKNGVVIASALKITALTCYRNIPCHQSCFYSRQLCLEKPYNPEYRIRADYDHFLWCYYKGNAVFRHMGFPVSCYEGEGFSEKPENRTMDETEHQKITATYMSKQELLKCHLFMWLTLGPIRKRMAESKYFSKLYHGLKECLYKNRNKIAIVILLFMVEMALFVWPVGWLRNDYNNFLAGNDAWNLEMSEETHTLTQKFRPQYDHLKSIGICLQKEALQPEESEEAFQEEAFQEEAFQEEAFQEEAFMGDSFTEEAFMEVAEDNQQTGSKTPQNPPATVTISIWDENTLLSQTTKDYRQVLFGQYCDFPLDCDLKAGKEYSLCVETRADAFGNYPSVSVCTTEYSMYENRELVLQESDRNEILEKQQLLTRYQYENAINFQVIMKAFFLSILTALGLLMIKPKDRRVRLLFGGFLLAAFPLVLGQRLEWMVIPQAQRMLLYPHAMKWNLMVMYGVEAVLLLVTCSPRLTLWITGIGLTILYSIDYFVYMFRGSSFRLNDLSAMGTAARVMENYKLIPGAEVAFAWGILALFLAWSRVCGVNRKAVNRNNENRKAENRNDENRKAENRNDENRIDRSRKRKRAVLRLIPAIFGVCVAVGSATYLTTSDFWEHRGFYVDTGMSSQHMYYYNGYLVTSCLDIKYSKVQKPSGYDKAKVESLLEKYQATDEHPQKEQISEKPHVILVMNESFSDLRTLGELELSEENMSFFHSLEGNVIRGNLYASVYGGGTANTEFEVLTGNTCSFLPSSYYPYQQGIANRDIPSVVSILKGQGYTTYAMHPATERNWNRGKVYENFGFENRFWSDEFQGAEKIHFGASDEATYRKVIELYEQRKPGEKQFIFDVTIQNHGGYEGDTIPLKVQAVNLDYTELNRYLTLVQKSDEAFEKLIEYFSKEEEKVVVCMFGDHQPKFVNGAFYDAIAGEQSLKEQSLGKYRVPFVIWANYPLQAGGPDSAESQNKGTPSEAYTGHQIAEMSMNYFGGYLLEQIGLKTSPYFAYLKELREEYPVITPSGYVDKDGVFFVWNGTQTEFLDYRNLQYYYMFD